MRRAATLNLLAPSAWERKHARQQQAREHAEATHAHPHPADDLRAHFRAAHPEIPSGLYTDDDLRAYHDRLDAP